MGPAMLSTKPPSRPKHSSISRHATFLNASQTGTYSAFDVSGGIFVWGNMHIQQGWVADICTHVSSFPLVSSAVPDGYLAESTRDRRPCGGLAEAGLRSSLRCSRTMPATIWRDRRPCGGLAEAGLRSSLRCSRAMPATISCDRRPWPTRGFIILLEGSEAASGAPRTSAGDGGSEF